MPRKLAAVFAVALCLASSNGTRADPGSVVNWLMNEPVSLFDLGIMRLARNQEELADKTRLKGKLRPAVPTVDYDWDRNRINLDWFVYIEKAYEENYAKENCRETLGVLRTNGGVNPRTGEIFHRPSLYSSHFSHFGYERPSAPDDYQDKLAHIIELKVSVVSLTDAGRSVCFGPLVSNKVYFEE